MLFLIDENLPVSVADIFVNLGFIAEYVGDISELRRQPDEIIFEYAVKNKAIIVTRDIGLVSLMRFPLKKLPGIILLRFPNEVTINKLSAEVNRLIKNFNKKDFYNLIVIEPGYLRKRSLK